MLVRASSGSGGGGGGTPVKIDDLPSSGVIDCGFQPTAIMIHGNLASSNLDVMWDDTLGTYYYGGFSSVCGKYGFSQVIDGGITSVTATGFTVRTNNIVNAKYVAIG